MGQPAAAARHAEPAADPRQREHPARSDDRVGRGGLPHPGSPGRRRPRDRRDRAARRRHVRAARDDPARARRGRAPSRRRIDRRQRVSDRRDVPAERRSRRRPAEARDGRAGVSAPVHRRRLLRRDAALGRRPHVDADPEHRFDRPSARARERRRVRLLRGRADRDPGRTGERCTSGRTLPIVLAGLAVVAGVALVVVALVRRRSRPASPQRPPGPPPRRPPRREDMWKD